MRSAAGITDGPGKGNALESSCFLIAAPASPYIEERWTTENVSSQLWSTNPSMPCPTGRAWRLGPDPVDRWEAEGLDPTSLHWNWFAGEATLGMDPKEFIYFCGIHRLRLRSSLRMTAPSPIATKGMVRKGLKARMARASMDEFIDFPVHTMADYGGVKKRFNPTSPQRYEPNWDVFRQGWHQRTHPLIFGPNCTTLGFYWWARNSMGTEGLSYAWYDQPALVHDIMEHHAEFLIEGTRPVLERTTVDYICLNEDMAMKTGPLLSPRTYKEFIFPRMKRVVDFYKSHGVRYVAVDTDGNPERLIPLLMDAGVDIAWPLERC